MELTNHITLLLILPLASYVLLGIWGRSIFKNIAGVLATGAMLLSTILAFIVAYQYFLVGGKVDGIYQPHIYKVVDHWLEFSPALSIDLGFLLDPIAAMMLLVVTVVSLMVHVYSLGYMKGEDRYGTYYAHLSLFTFSMLGLVLSTNIFQIYMFWELVGVSSFLLIGFYFNKPSARAAAKKAFIVTRFADLGFLIGILVLSFYGQSLDMPTLIKKLTDPQSTELQAALTGSFLGMSALAWGLLLVFIGGAGKSAQFPLHIWLPDAMEGPTPVSALIHAATMVVAGVYLVARLFPIFSVQGDILQVISYVGAFSALFAALIAITQTDIKRVLAYSTMSQIGYMLFSLGVARYGGESGLGFTASMFHLFTHAFFKALLFLGAGTVIHYMHSNEMRDMGGLRKYLPVTHLSFLIACLAIAGIPFFSGFFSKEEILLAAYESDPTIYWVAFFTSGLTAFYMFRLYFNIFWNKSHHPHGEHHGDAEGGWVMKLPLIVLALATLGVGYISFGEFVSADGKALEGHLHLLFSIAPVSFALIGIGLAYLLYKKENPRPQALAAHWGVFYKAAYHKFYIDELYLFITKKILFNGIACFAAWFDVQIINALVNGIAAGTEWVSGKIRRFQSGKVQEYAMVFLGGVIVITWLLIYVLKS